MVLSLYVVNFILYSFLGWIYECIYAAFTRQHWDNRGFLFSPICPIYGFGVLAGKMLLVFGFGRNASKAGFLELFLISAFASAILEFVTSYTMEKIFHARWWDYSDVPGNIQGRICLPASIGFGFAGVLIIKYLLPETDKLFALLPPVYTELLALLFTGLISADFAITTVSMTQLLQKLEAMQAEFDAKMEQNVVKASMKTRNVVKVTNEMLSDIGEEMSEAVNRLSRDFAGRISAMEWSQLKRLRRIRRPERWVLIQRIRKQRLARKSGNKKSGS